MKIDDKPVRTNLSVILLLLVVFFGSSTKASAANVKLKWDASPSLNVTNYVVYYGTERGTYSFTNNVSTNLTTTVSNLTVGVRYYFVVTAKDAIGLESDPSDEVPFTGGNTWPVITGLLDQAVITGTSSGPIGFIVGDSQSQADALALSSESSDPALVPPGNIVFGGSGASRMVTVMPASGKSGMATITIGVSDGELTTTTNFLVTVSLIASSPGVQIISPAYGTMIYEGGSILLAANATSPAGILKAEFFDGATKLGEDLVVPYSFRHFGLTEGIHNYSVRVIDSLDVTNTSSVVSVWVIPVSPIPTVNLRSPVAGGQYIVADNILLRGEASSADSTIARVEFYEGEIKLGEAVSGPYEVTVSNVLAGAHTYTARAFAASGMTNVSVPIPVNVGFVTTVADALSPTLVINNVAENSRLTSGAITIKGIARDNRKLLQVIYAINNEPYRAAVGTTNWQIQANLVPGTNKVRVVGFDYKGNRSVTNVRTLFYVVTNGFTLLTNGAGTISGVINRHVLEVGKGYQLMAVPKPGNLFSNWTAGSVVLGTNPVLNFQMISNLVLQANFVTNHFLGRQGVYSGLAYDPNNVTFSKAGFFRLTMSDRRTFSGSTIFAGGVYPFTGRFWVDGRATVRIARPGRPGLTSELAIDLVGNSGITGTVTDGTFTVPLRAERPGFGVSSSAPYEGRYTIVVPAAGEVAGDGVGIVKMSSGGSVMLAGTLADGTVIAQSSPVSSTGLWPLYVPLYAGKGMVNPIIVCSNFAKEFIASSIEWIR